MAASGGKALRRQLALSLTGSGHLMIYQIGVCRVLHDASMNYRETYKATSEARAPTIDYAVGASGGAIAAALLCRAPDALDDYAQVFINKRGGGLDLLEQYLQMYQQAGPRSFQSLARSISSSAALPKLNIALTQCDDGKSRIFSFPLLAQGNESNDDLNLVLKCVEASCRIPPTFHPFDVLSSSPSSYPNEHGIIINGNYYVDGGISTPAPPTPLTSTEEGDEGASHFYDRVIVTPLSGTSQFSDRISPKAVTPTFLQIQAVHDLGVDVVALSNLRALQASAGHVSNAQLRNWYIRGQNDAAEWLERKFGASS